jgi:hypothetical protein
MAERRVVDRQVAVVDLAARRAHAEEFVRRQRRLEPDGSPLSDAERVAIENGARRYTRAMGYRWHGRAQWTGSPRRFADVIERQAAWPDAFRRRSWRCSSRSRLLPRRRRWRRHAVGWVVLIVPIVPIVAAVAATLITMWWGGSPAVVVTVLTNSLMLAAFLSVVLAPDRAHRPLHWWNDRRIPPWRLSTRVPFILTFDPDRFRAWAPQQMIRPSSGPSGQIDLLGAIGVDVADDHVFLGPRYGRDAEAWPLRFRQPRRGPGWGLDGRVTPVELSWLVERDEVAPRRLAVAVLDAHAAMGRAFAVGLFRDVAVVLDPPLHMRCERLPDGTDRLHCDDAPALEWANGEAVYALHGTIVPPDLVREGWSVERIDQEWNSEVRRQAIERMGWETYIRGAGLRPVGTAPDPGNDGAVLELFDLPRDDARVLVMRNGSPDRDGARRLYAEAVPSHIDDPVEAAAWQYGCPVEVYRHLQRRT